MTDKQQIIEEMVDAMVISCGECYSCPFSGKTNNRVSCTDYLTAEALYYAGYRKVDENAVVLTREEFDRLNSCIKSEEEVRAIMQQQMLPMVRELTDKEVGKKLATVTALVHKETAKEVLENIKTLVEWGWEMSRIEKWICKNYGVEVE